MLITPRRSLRTLALSCSLISTHGYRLHPLLLTTPLTTPPYYTPLQVRIEHAFNSPENLLQCAEFLRKQISEMRAQAAVVVTPKSKVGYPQVWKGKPKGVWKYGDSDGIFLQLEAPSGLRQM